MLTCTVLLGHGRRRRVEISLILGKEEVDAAAGAAVARVSEEDFDFTVDTNFKGTLFTVQKLLPPIPDAGQGYIGYGGVEWMRAGGGVWHGNELLSGSSERIHGLQLWLALPADLERHAGRSMVALG